MQDRNAIRPAIPADALALLPPGQIGPAPDDWRIAALALTGANGEPGWVAVRVHPFTVLPLVEDQETAEVIAAEHGTCAKASMSGPRALLEAGRHVAV